MPELQFHGPGMGMSSVTFETDDELVQQAKDFVKARDDGHGGILVTLDAADDEGEAIVWLPVTTVVKFVFDGPIPKELLAEAGE